LSEKFNKDHLGIFANSFYLSNYEFTYKTAPPQKEEDNKSEEEKDERTKKHNKKISQVKI